MGIALKRTQQEENAYIECRILFQRKQCLQIHASDSSSLTFTLTPSTFAVPASSVVQTFLHHRLPKVLLQCPHSPFWSRLRAAVTRRHLIARESPLGVLLNQVILSYFWRSVSTILTLTIDGTYKALYAESPHRPDGLFFLNIRILTPSLRPKKSKWNWWIFFLPRANRHALYHTQSAVYFGSCIRRLIKWKQNLLDTNYLIVPVSFCFML